MPRPYRRVLMQKPVLVASPASFHTAPALALPPFRFAESDAPLLTIRHEKTILLYVTEHALALYLLAKAFQQLLL